MAFKEILVHLDDHQGYEARLRLALALAQAHKAHLVALYGFELPVAPRARNVVGVYAEDNVLRTAYERERDAAYANASSLEAAFHLETRRAGLSAEWEVRPDKATDLIAFVTKRARYADLAVLGQAHPDHPFFDTLAKLPEAVMLGCGRPALIVPAGSLATAVGERVLVAWNGTREAARAVGDALPLLRHAAAVTVVSVSAHANDEDGDTAADLARHLSRHEIPAASSHLVASDIGAAGEVILAQAEELGCDLIVMGGYGHSRTRELILGGVTRAVLQRMTIPVLMSH